MLTIYEGSFRSSGREKLIAEIEKRVVAKGRCVLIVPEQQTAIAEAEMAELLPAFAPLVFEATNFTRLANTVFRKAGGLAGRSAKKGERALLMWRTLTELSDTLSFLKDRKNKQIAPGAITKMLSAVAEMKSLSITAETLTALGTRDGLNDDRLKAKLSDLSQTMTVFDRFLREKFADNDSDLDRVSEKIAENPELFEDTAICLEGFTSFTEPQYRVLEKLAARCDVTIWLAIPKERHDAFPFAELKKCELRLLAIADKAGADKRIEKLDGNAGADLLGRVGGLLWSSEQSIDDIDYNSLQKDSPIRVFEAENPYEEADFVAADIQRRVMNEAKPARYSDFAVVCRRADAYVGILDNSLGEAKIPFFFSRRAEISSFEPMRLFAAAYRAIDRDFSRRDVIDFAKCPLAVSDTDAVDEFEIYTETWQISGKQMLVGGWNMNPQGMTDRMTDATAAKIARVNQTREVILTPLVELKAKCECAKTVRDHAAALVELMLSLSLREKLDARAKELREIGETDRACDTGALYGSICDALDRLVFTVGECTADVKTFYSLLEILFSELNIGHIPAYSDCVTVGSADQIRLFGKKYVYLFGCSDGEFPESVADDSYFSEHDKSALKSVMQTDAEDFPLEPDLNLRCARELFCFSRAFSFAEECVTLLYPRCDAAFAPAVPSQAIDSIIDLTKGAVKAEKISSLPMLDRTYHPGYAVEHLSSVPEEKEGMTAALTEIGFGDRLHVREGDLQNSRLKIGEEMASLLFGKTIRLSSSKLDTFLSCPMKYFCQETLGLREIERADFDARNVGTFVHYILEHFFKTVQDRKIDFKEMKTKLTEEQRKEIIRDASEAYMRSIFPNAVGVTPEMDHAADRLCRASLPIVNGLCDEFENCEFKPVVLECRLGDDGAPDRAKFESKTSGVKVEIDGRIDRIDAAKKGGENDVYLRVIDYKTGTKTFSPGQLKEGENLQMFLYLKAACETETEEFRKRVGVTDPNAHLIPAGLIYVNCPVGDVSATLTAAQAEKLGVKLPATIKIAEKEAAKNYKTRAGMIRNDPDVIDLMNKDFIPVRFNKDGTFNGTTEDRVFDGDRWKELDEAVSASVCGTADKIVSGNVEATPLIKKKTVACTHCAFKAFCRSAEK